MNLRRAERIEAASWATVVAIPAAAVTVQVFSGDPQRLVMAACAVASTFLMTLLVWPHAFPRASAGPWRALWVGPLIVCGAMWITLLIIAYANAEIAMPTLAGLFDHAQKMLFVTVLLTFFGLFYAGIIIIPTAIVATYLIRKRQLRRRLAGDTSGEAREKSNVG